MLVLVWRKGRSSLHRHSFLLWWCGRELKFRDEAFGQGHTTSQKQSSISNPGSLIQDQHPFHCMSLSARAQRGNRIPLGWFDGGRLIEQRVGFWKSTRDAKVPRVRQEQEAATITGLEVSGGEDGLLETRRELWVEEWLPGSGWSMEGGIPAHNVSWSREWGGRLIWQCLHRGSPSEGPSKSWWCSSWWRMTLNREREGPTQTNYTVMTSAQRSRCVTGQDLSIFQGRLPGPLHMWQWV